MRKRRESSYVVCQILLEIILGLEPPAIWPFALMSLMYDSSLNVGLDGEVHEVNVGVVLLAVCHERDEGLSDSMTHPPTQTVHMGLMEANRFQEWCLRPEEFIHDVLEWRNSEILTNTQRLGQV